MKVIIAGGRGLAMQPNVMQSVVDTSGYEPTEVVSGDARGIDRWGAYWAALVGIPVVKFPADWLKLGKSAGPVRNRAMADYADALIAVWDGKSPGTRNMIETMQRLGKPVHVHLVT